MYAEVRFGGKVSDEVEGSVRPDLARGVVALRERARFEPYLAGAELTLADFGAAIHLPLVSYTTRSIYGDDPLDAIPGVRAHQALMNERASLVRVKADRREDLPKFERHRLRTGG